MAGNTASSQSATEERPAVNLDGRRVVIVGLGGIGSWLAHLVTTYLASLRGQTIELLLVDGDTFEDRNRERMEIPEMGNKAEVICDALTELHGRRRFYIRPLPEFVDTENVAEIIEENDIVLACVDNHATRKIIGDHCRTLNNMSLISGGNDGVEEGTAGTYGNVQIYRRVDSTDHNPHLSKFHPEIADPNDEVPGPSCADLAATTAPQIVFTNHFAATAMGAAFYGLLSSDVQFDELCFDVLEGRAVPRKF